MVFRLSRRRQPTRPPTPPEALLAGVGSGDYYAIGEQALALLQEHAGLKKSDRILDVGCGLGRLAWPLSGVLRGRGSYDGFDPVRPYVDWCAENLHLDPARFRFHHADIRTSLYNPTGTIEAEVFPFPWPDRSFDLTIAASLFTHLLPAAASHYLGEIARTLDRGGRLFATFFVLDREGREAVAKTTAKQDFTTAIEHGLLHDPAVPESAVAYDETWLFDALARTGLDVAAFHPGYWKGKPGLEYQDMLLARRRG